MKNSKLHWLEKVCMYRDFNTSNKAFVAFSASCFCAILELQDQVNNMLKDEIW